MTLTETPVLETVPASAETLPGKALQFGEIAVSSTVRVHRFVHKLFQRPSGLIVATAGIKPDLEASVVDVKDPDIYIKPIHKPNAATEILRLGTIISDGLDYTRSLRPQALPKRKPFSMTETTMFLLD